MNSRFFVLAAALAAFCYTAPLFAEYPVAVSGIGGSESAGVPDQFPGSSMLLTSPHMMAVSPAAFEAPIVDLTNSLSTSFTAASNTTGCDGSCGGTCGGGCGGKGGKGGKGDCCCACCLSGGWCHRASVYGEFIFLRSRDSEVAYAVPFDGPVVPGPPNTVQVGPVGVVDMDFQPSFRFGFDYILNQCSKVGATYTMFESGTTDSVATQAPNVVRSMVSHPNVDSAGQSFLEANAAYDISYDILDVHFQQLLSYCDDYQLGFLVGTRIMQHEQELQVDFLVNGTETVVTDIDFYGAGLRAGLEYERYVACQWTLFAKGYGNLIPGEFRADFDQGQSYDARVIDTSWKAGRLVTIWELEMGVGWTSKCGWYSASAGYHFSAWTNMVQTDEWVRGVHQNNFIDMDDTSTFDGLTARAEVRF